MNQKPDTEYSCFWKGSKEHIAAYHWIRMERVKVNAASIGVKNGIGEKMIQVYCHRQHHVKPGLRPFGLIAYSGSHARHNKVKDQVDCWSEH